MFRSNDSREGAGLTSAASPATSRNDSSLSQATTTLPPSAGGGASASHDIPRSIVYNFPSFRGPTPSGRWAHSTCALGPLLVVYGGIGTMLYDDLWMLDTDTLSWRSLSPRAASSKDIPEKAMGHAVAALGSKMWLFGGQQGRSLLRKLYVLDLEAMTWCRMAKGSDTLPSARAGHAMVPVPALGTIYLFGGQGKKLHNDLYRLDPETGLFTEVKATGRPPLPRRGMSLVYDGKDSLVCFGGAHAGGADAALSVFSISRGDWYSPMQQGSTPAARTNHSAVLLAPHQVLVFGGCNTQGNFFSDAYILDTCTFTWHAPRLLNAAPAPRYHHTCCVVGGRAYFYGGINSKQTFDGVVVLDTRYDNEISNIAEELRALSSIRAPSGDVSSADTSHTSRGSVASFTPSTASASVDLMKGQLVELLYKRNMEEVHQHANIKLEALELQLGREREAGEALRRENLQLKILAADAEEAAAAAAERARGAAAAVAKGVAVAAELRSALEAKERALAERQAEVESARRLHHGLVKELGLVASRHAKLQQQQQQQKASGRSNLVSTMPNHRASISSDAPRPCSDAATTSDGTRRTAAHSAPLHSLFELEYLQARSDKEQEVVFDEMDGVPTSSSSGEASSHQSGHPVLAHFEDILALLQEVEQQKEELGAALAAAAARCEAGEAEAAGLRAQLAAARGERSALLPLSDAELAAVEEQLEAALRTTREVHVARRLAAVERAASEQQACSLCLEQPRGVVFNCGHQSCAACSEKLVACPFCRTAISARIKVFHS